MGRYATPPDEEPIAPVDFPERLSQTLMAHENRCPRSAIFYLQHMGTMRSHEMDRGTLAHVCAERLMAERMLHEGEGPERAGQPDRYEIDAALPVDAQEEALSMQTGALVDAVRRELGERVHISAEQADIARICTFHLALGLDVKPSDVLSMERKWVLDLAAGWEISVIADLITLPEDFEAEVIDYKTLPQPTPAGEWDTFQTKVAAVALLYGYPLTKQECESCDGPGVVTCGACGGRGYVEVRGERGAGVGAQLQRVRGREIYPRPKLSRIGRLQDNQETWTRLELDEFRADLEFAGERITERLLSWIWPARRGSWCARCPGRLECPIAPELRGFAGAVEDREHAGQLWQLAQAMKDMGGDFESLVKEWSKATGQSVEMGDYAWAWLTSETKALKRRGKSTDWEGLEDAITGAVTLGHPFKLEDWIKLGRRTEFKKTKVNREGEVPYVDGADAAAGDAGKRDGAGAERFGDDAPF
jgi:hypothetical protein